MHAGDHGAGLRLGPPGDRPGRGRHQGLARFAPHVPQCLSGVCLRRRGSARRGSLGRRFGEDQPFERLRAHPVLHQATIDVERGRAIDAQRLGQVDVGPDALRHALVGQGGLEGRAQIELRDASSAMTPVRPLGSYRVEIVGRGGQADLSIQTLAGPLRLQGSGSFTAQTGLRFTAEASADPAERASLRHRGGTGGAFGRRRRPGSLRCFVWVMPLRPRTAARPCGSAPPSSARGSRL
ncbi:MAG: type II secretion system protein N, partial [Phycisphaerae bacterium]|nr:type II secretion system protein N [Phycisphaerae bacterium]